MLREEGRELPGEYVDRFVQILGKLASGRGVRAAIAEELNIQWSTLTRYCTSGPIRGGRDMTKTLEILQATGHRYKLAKYAICGIRSADECVRVLQGVKRLRVDQAYRAINQEIARNRPAREDNPGGEHGRISAPPLTVGSDARRCGALDEASIGSSILTNLIDGDPPRAYANRTRVVLASLLEVRGARKIVCDKLDLRFDSLTAYASHAICKSRQDYATVLRIFEVLGYDYRLAEYCIGLVVDPRETIHILHSVRGLEFCAACREISARAEAEIARTLIHQYMRREAGLHDSMPGERDEAHSSVTA